MTLRGNKRDVLYLSSQYRMIYGQVSYQHLVISSHPCPIWAYRGSLPWLCAGIFFYFYAAKNVPYTPLLNYMKYKGFYAEKTGLHRPKWQFLSVLRANLSAFCSILRQWKGPFAGAGVWCVQVDAWGFSDLFHHYYVLLLSPLHECLHIPHAGAVPRPPPLPRARRTRLRA